MNANTVRVITSFFMGASLLAGTVASVPRAGKQSTGLPNLRLCSCRAACTGQRGIGGRTVIVGLPSPDARISVSPLGFVAEGRSLIGSYLGSAVPSQDIPHFVGLWRAGRLPVEKLVSSTITLDEINSGMDQLADGHAVRQLISFD